VVYSIHLLDPVGVLVDLRILEVPLEVLTILVDLLLLADQKTSVDLLVVQEVQIDQWVHSIFVAENSRNQ
jgi:hypothetical protein